MEQEGTIMKKLIALSLGFVLLSALCQAEISQEAQFIKDYLQSLKFAESSIGIMVSAGQFDPSDTNAIDTADTILEKMTASKEELLQAKNCLQKYAASGSDRIKNAVGFVFRVYDRVILLLDRDAAFYNDRLIPSMKKNIKAAGMAQMMKKVDQMQRDRDQVWQTLLGANKRIFFELVAAEPAPGEEKSDRLRISAADRDAIIQEMTAVFPGSTGTEEKQARPYPEQCVSLMYKMISSMGYKASDEAADAVKAN